MFRYTQTQFTSNRNFYCLGNRSNDLICLRLMLHQTYSFTSRRYLPSSTSHININKIKTKLINDFCCLCHILWDVSNQLNTVIMLPFNNFKNLPQCLIVTDKI